MKKEALLRKERFVSHLYSTAEHNGKEVKYSDAVDFANWLHRCETTLSRLAEEECFNENYDSEKQKRTENRVENAITNVIGCKCYTQRDPRGFAIRLYLVDDKGNPWSNNWDNETSACDW